MAILSCHVSIKLPPKISDGQDILAYLDSAGIKDENKDMPLFYSTVWKTKQLTGKALTTKAICELVKRRLKDAGLPKRLSPHSFRVAAITDVLTHGVPLEDVQHLAGHAESRTTGLYDRRQKKVRRNIVERISIYALPAFRGVSWRVSP